MVKKSYLHFAVEIVFIGQFLFGRVKRRCEDWFRRLRGEGMARRLKILVRCKTL